MSTLYLMVGIPASGKSTKVAELEKNGAVRISSDVVRGELFGDEGIQYTEEWLKENGFKLQEGEDEETAKRTFAIKLIFAEVYKRAIDYLKNGKDVILDSTNISKSARKMAFDNLGKYVDKVVANVMAVSYEECMRRNSGRDRVVPEEVMRRLADSFNIPDYSEGIDEIRFVGNKDDINYGS